MGAIMSEWLERHRAILSTFVPFGLQASLVEPAFYGAVVNNYKIHRGGKKKSSYLKWEELIKEAIVSSLLDGKGLKPASPGASAARVRRDLRITRQDVMLHGTCTACRA